MRYLTLVVWIGFCPVSAVIADDMFIVKDGQPNSEIIIAEKPPRSTWLAAHELRHYVEKITGAQLKIVTEPTGTVPVYIYVGQSPHTKARNITTEGLKDGAYRIVSGKNWLTLIGDDTNFVPIDPWPRNNNDWTSGRVHQEWDKITGATWGNPMSQLRKHYMGRIQNASSPPDEPTDPPEVWGFDERGSFNAVCGFLRSLGVRWFMPGEIGEVLPELTSIPLPEIDEITRPDFPVRRFNIRFGVHGHDTAMWAMRLGVRDPYGLQVAHGMHTMTHRDEVFKNHPEWFALYGGKRQNQPGQRLNQLCYGNDELFRETVRYVQAQFDHYQFDVVSVMPPDGYTAICQCPLCEGKDTPDRGSRGRLSDYVWDFVNRVAKEVKKSHPDKMITCCAYGAYQQPPLKIEKLESNVLVCIVGGRRPQASRPEEREAIQTLRQAWVKKTDNPILIFENAPFTDRGHYLPSFLPHVIGESINATKGISQGEDIWLSVRQDFDTVAIGYNHFLVYFTARMYWGGKDQDVEALFDEYCRLFYGPAGESMKAFFNYCEANWQDMSNDKAKVDRTFELLAAARDHVEADSVHGKRIDLIEDYLEGLKNKGRQLAQKRGPVPQFRLARDVKDVQIDGKLDDPFWKNCPIHATARLRELQTGRTPTFNTTFKAGWGRDGSLYIGIRCEDRAGEPLNIGTTKNGDPAIWYGDVVEMLFETDAHSYYQIAVNPAGAIVDLDRGASKDSWDKWDAKAEVATHIAEDHWTVEIRIPVVEDANDPLHQIVGRKPIASLPWHFNICRQRVRENGTELSAFSPTGTNNFHRVMKFAHLYEGRSHQFSAAEIEPDYLEADRAASRLASQGKHAEALTAFTTLADGKITAYQKSAALEQAAVSARSLGRFDLATELADRIPLDAVANTVRMRNHLAQRQPEKLIEQFKDKNLDTWPFWKISEASFLRGQAYHDVGNGDAAERDLTRALEYVSDHRERLNMLLVLALNRETNRDDPKAALQAYQQIASAPRNTGSATYFRGVQGAARLLTRDGKFDDALETLRQVETDKLRGFWRGSMMLAIGETLKAAGRTDEALTTFKTTLSDATVEANHRKAAQEAINAIQQEK